MNVKQISQRFGGALAALAVAIAGVTVGFASPASAGNGGNPQPTYVAPAGFESAYAFESGYVAATCNFEVTNPAAFQTSAFVYKQVIKPFIDLTLRAANDPPSPTFSMWRNSANLLGRCPVG